VKRRTLGSPVGRLTVSARDGHIVGVAWTRGPVPGDDEDPLLDAAEAALRRYFAGDPAPFDLPLSPDGTDHQRRVWQAMCAIPFGSTATDGTLADRVGSSARAVGTACGANPIPIIIPCHRVVAQSGPGGYSGGDGLPTKYFLLALEGTAFC
jgi:methylated-DNA-[protein]-cysteine S-methyltransferase